MNKAELVNQVADETGLNKRDVAKVINAALGVTSCTLEEGDKVTLVGFGTFLAVQREARVGRNPQTGEKLQISSKRVPKFMPGKGLKEKVK